MFRVLKSVRQVRKQFFLSKSFVTDNYFLFVVVEESSDTPSKYQYFEKRTIAKLVGDIDLLRSIFVLKIEVFETDKTRLCFDMFKLCDGCYSNNFAISIAENNEHDIY